MSHKYYYSYIILIFENIGIKFDFNKNHHTATDFEDGLRKAIHFFKSKLNFRRLFFHFIKALWNKAKKFGLMSKDKI